MDWWKLGDKGKSLRFIAYGVGLIAISVFLFAFVTKEASLVVIVTLMAVRGIGIGLSNMTVTTIGLNSLTDDNLHEGSALSNTIKRLGSSVTVMLLVGYYDVRWQMISRLGENAQYAKWTALREECIALGCLMILTIPLALLLNKKT